MARIDAAELTRMKAEISLERLVTAQGVKLERHGKDLLGRCPFHDDHEPSLVVSPASNLWHCLGACQTGGTVIDWVMKAEGVSFRHAVELLREDVTALTAEVTSGAPKHSTVRRLAAPVERSADDQAVLARVVDFYHATLQQSPEALAYLGQRGLAHPEVVDQFRLGYANRTLGYRLPDKNRVAGAELRGRLEQLGVYRESGHEHLSGSLVIPIFDEQGRVAGMYGRKIARKLRAGTPLHLYLPGPHRGVWNLPALRASGTLILCESLIDALTFWVAGYRQVTASYGTQGFTDDHRTALQAHATERVYIAYDRDEAGDRAAERVAEELGAVGIECFRVLFPKGMDANEYALKVQPAAQSLGLALRQARWMGKGPAPASRDLERVGAGSSVPEATKGENASGVVSVEAVAVTIATAGDVEPEPAPPDEAEPAAAATAATAATATEPITSPMDPAPGPGPAPRIGEHAPASIEPTGADDEVVYRFGDRRWRIRGLAKNTAPEALKVNVLVARDGGGFHVDGLELYSARQRGHFVRLASEKLGVEERILKRDLGAVLLGLEERMERQRQEAETAKDAAPKLSEAETAEALALLRDPELLERILGDFERCGVVGEETNKLVGYLGATSRKLDEPLAVVIQSSSAAGKSSLMDAVLALMPEEERVQYSAMTGQALFYMGEGDLRHKILAIVEEEGAERASYALKLLQSEGQLSIASTGKDPATGRLVTQEYRVEGPVMIFLTTTAIEVDEELLNRCLVLSVDEGREQTRAIHERQRLGQTLEGMLARHERKRVLTVHRNAQRLLRPLAVVNPHACELTFLDHATRTRRDHMKYLTLIRTIALLHQYQREVKTVQHREEEIR
ncbi:MAG: toprim domain-containing protein [Polyangiaceae bacterium]|nr:toprim domain-containing protein [Polyangiaceae bacterium]